MAADLVAKSAPGTRSQLDSSTIGTPDRFDAWTEAVSKSFVPLQAEPKQRGGVPAFGGTLVAQSLGRAEISTVTGEAVAVRRSDRSIAEANPGYIKLGLQLRGYSVISQDDRDAALAPGDFAIYDTTRPYLLDFDDAFAMFVVMFPAESLRATHDSLRPLTASRFSGRRGIGAVASSFLAELSRQLDAGPVSTDPSLTDAVLDLVIATLSEHLGGSEAASEAGSRRTLLLRIQADMAGRLSDPDLSVARIADEYHVSVRYLQKLFEEHHETVSGWLRHHRLDRSRRDLGNVLLRDRPVAAIGSDWGFLDAAAYSRAFRSEFGMTPGEYRQVMRETEIE